MIKQILICGILLLSPVAYSLEVIPTWGLMALFAGDLPKDNTLRETIETRAKEVVESLKNNKELCSVVLVDAPSGATRHEIRRGKHREIPLAELDLGHPYSLIHHWITPYKKLCGARKTAAIISSHGSGWSGTIGGKKKRDHLTIQRLRKALASYNDQIDLLVLDICSMSSLEVATELSPHVKYLLAAEQRLDNQGISWTALTKLSPAVTLDELTTRIFEDSELSLSSPNRLDGDLAWLDLSEIAPLNIRLKKLVFLSNGEFRLWNDPFEEGNPNSDLKNILKFLASDQHSSLLIKSEARASMLALQRVIKRTTSRMNGGLSWYVPKLANIKRIKFSRDQKKFLALYQELMVGKEINWSTMVK